MERIVRILPYDPAWPAQARAAAEEVAALLGPGCLAVHHIGSTSVPGLAAKPILDLMPVVETLSAADRCREGFEALGYTWLGEYGIPGRRYLRRGCGPSETVHLHIFSPENAADIARHLAVREYLTAHPEEAAAYAAKKTAVAAAVSGDWDAYCDGKEAFVRELEQRALAWFSTARPNFPLW